MPRPLTATTRPAGLASTRSNRSARVRPHPTTITRGEAAVLGFLEDILVGDTTWSLGEVRNMLAMHAHVGLGQFSSEGVHPAGAAT